MLVNSSRFSTTLFYSSPAGSIDDVRFLCNTLLGMLSILRYFVSSSFGVLQMFGRPLENLSNNNF